LREGTERRLVKRMLICAGVVIALALATAALANTRSFSGRFQGGGTVSFQAKFRHGEAVKVRQGWAWANLPVPCRGPHQTTSNAHFTFAMPVNDKRKFRGVGFAQSGARKSRAAVRGRFSRSGRRAHGTFRLRGNVNGQPECDTGHVVWHAHH
jgi:hypothetical protein